MSTQVPVSVNLTPTSLSRVPDLDHHTLEYTGQVTYGSYGEYEIKIILKNSVIAEIGNGNVGGKHC